MEQTQESGLSAFVPSKRINIAGVCFRLLRRKENPAISVFSSSSPSLRVSSEAGGLKKNFRQQSMLGTLETRAPRFPRYVNGGKNVKTLSNWTIIISSVLLTAGIATGDSAEKQANNESRLRIEMKYMLIAAEKLGSYIAANHSGARVLLLTPAPRPGVETAENIQLLTTLCGLQLGFVGQARLIGTADIAPDQNGKPLNQWFTADTLRKAIAPYAGKYDVIVTTLGLPLQIASDDLKSLGLPESVTIAVFGGPIFQFKPLIVSGRIIAAITPNRQAQYEPNPQPDKLSLQNFNDRWVLVTPETIEDDISEGRVMFAQ